ncbi:uncharacterized protein V1516DRAFT_693601 [Lipomyces oligophaga]|uniref:uncharacterized protein n=1 Tax=Lipomyces oligophaga TaxID=45792 RepID=UPI0034CFB8CE
MENTDISFEPDGFRLFLPSSPTSYSNNTSPTRSDNIIPKGTEIDPLINISGPIRLADLRTRSTFRRSKSNGIVGLKPSPGGSISSGTTSSRQISGINGGDLHMSSSTRTVQTFSENSSSPSSVMKRTNSSITDDIRSTAYAFAIKLTCLTMQTLPVLRLPPPSFASPDLPPPPFVKVISQIFECSETRVGRDVLVSNGTLNAEDYVRDLKSILTSIKLANNPDLESEFDTPIERGKWVEFEQMSINQILLSLIALLPRLTSVESSTSLSRTLVFIPQNPVSLFHLILKTCIQNHLPTLLSTSGDALVDYFSSKSISLVDHETKDFINTTTMRWRITKNTQDAVTLAVGVELYNSGILAEPALLNIVRTVSPTFQDSLKSYLSVPEPWKKSDLMMYETAIMAVYDILLKKLKSDMIVFHSISSKSISNSLALIQLYIISDPLIKSVPMIRSTLNAISQFAADRIDIRYHAQLDSLTRLGTWPDLVLFNSFVSEELLLIARKNRTFRLDPSVNGIDIPWVSRSDMKKVVARKLVTLAFQTGWSVFDHLQASQNFPSFDDVTYFYFTMCQLRVASGRYHLAGLFLNIESKMYSLVRQIASTEVAYIWIEGLFDSDTLVEGKEYTNSAQQVLDMVHRRLDAIQKLQWNDEAQFSELMIITIGVCLRMVRSYIATLKVKVVPGFNHFPTVQAMEVSKKLQSTLANIKYVRDSLQDILGTVDIERLNEVLRRYKARSAQATESILRIRISDLHVHPIVRTTMERSPSYAYISLSSLSGSLIECTRPVIWDGSFSWNEDMEISVVHQSSCNLVVDVKSLVEDGSYVDRGIGNIELDFADRSLLDAYEWALNLRPIGKLNLDIQLVEYSISKSISSTLDAFDRLSLFLNTLIGELLYPKIISTLSEANIELAKQNQTTYMQYIHPLLEYFDSSFEYFSSAIDYADIFVIRTVVWARCVAQLNRILQNLKADNGTDKTDKNVVNEWFQRLRKYFYTGGDSALPINIIEGVAHFDELLLCVY